ncbi:hypothetical protein KR093_007928 [Drosophila rubida]|uniref:MADF domain-containing protein n=1 Tax=Drosophila rubida TaxID=30044 RepID=A0AAD4K8H1_9MUSC|nr:hypothetical protein KR093_007928 [Drosophila rubida]
MEARRLERQRRASAKSSAAPTLPSSQDEDFHLRMIDLYAQQPCLWNTTLCEYHDAELKRNAWEEITRKLGAHLNASFVRSRIRGMRYRLNVYKLQLLEHKMSPSSAKPPEKLFFMDRFGFLDTMISSDDEEQPEPSDSEQGDLKSSLSIASICEQRVQQQQMQLPHLLQRLKSSHRGNQSSEPDVVNIPSVVKKRQLPALQVEPSGSNEQPGSSTGLPQASPLQLDSALRRRMQRLSLIEHTKEQPHDSSDVRGSVLNIPSVVRKRLQQQLTLEGPLLDGEAEKSSAKGYAAVLPGPSQLSLPQVSGSMRAQPGDSISKTRVSKSTKTSALLQSQQQSDDEDLYRLHWSVRQEQRSRRADALPPRHELHPSQAMPPLLFGTSLPSPGRKPNLHGAKHKSVSK